MTSEQGSQSRPGSRFAAVRMRTTLVAVLVVGLALGLAAVTLVLLLRRSLTNDVRSAAFFRAEATIEVVRNGPPSTTIRIADGEDEFVQVADASGHPIAASANVAGEPLLAELDPGESLKIEVPFEDEPFLAVSITEPTDEGSYTIVAGQTMENVIESGEIVINLLFVGVPLLTGIVGLVTWRLVGRALSPVERIREEVETITTAHLDRRVPVPPTEDEIARLASTMNEMLDRLETGDQKQRRFISDASHELRSPVAAMRQHLEVALAHPESASTQDLAKVLLQEDLRMERLVEDLLLLARLDEGVAEPTAALSLDDLVFEEIDRLRATTDKRIDVGRVSGGRVRGDERQLRRLVGNLIDNALRHASGTVVVSLTEAGSRVVLEVSDDGSGIPEAERKRIFERFVRLDEARDRDSGGSGLGLAIVGEVVRAHRGEIEVGDSSLGGALFRVELPAAT